MIQDIANINYVHLPPQPFMGGINAYQPAIPAEPRMRVDPVLAIANVHATIAFQFGQRHKLSRGPMK